MSMRSIFTDKVDKTCPLPEYPRPQLVRENWLNLNGEFDYAVLPRTEKWAEKYDGKILVPFAIESMLSGVEKPLLPSDRLWYRKVFTVPESMQGKHILLHFGAVDWQCKVYINHTLAYMTRPMRGGSNAASRLSRRTDFGTRRPPVFGRPFGWRLCRRFMLQNFVFYRILIKRSFRSLPN